MFHRVGLAVVRDEGLLMVRKKGSRFWAIPGGRVEPQEDARAALARELREELHVGLADGVAEAGIFVDQAADTDEQFRLTLYVGEIKGVPKPAGEIAEHVWFDGTLSDGSLPPMFVHHVQPALAKLIGWQPARTQATSDQ